MSAPPKRIFLNGLPRDVDVPSLSFAKILRLAFFDPKEPASIVFQTPSGENGSLAPGDVLGIAEGLRLTILRGEELREA